MRACGVLLPFFLASCAVTGSENSGAAAHLRLSNAQFVAGPLPDAAETPVVAAVELLSHSFWPGQSNKPLRGSLGPSATAAIIALSDDIGFWIVGAGVPDVATPELPTFKTTAAFSRDLTPGSYYLDVHAVDGSGRVGPASTQALTALSDQPLAQVSGALVVALAWSSPADLDLHVVDPLGTEVYHGQATSFDAFSSSALPSSIGTLDVDANADCQGTATPSEHVVWKKPPPAGHYLVRVDAASLCGLASAAWKTSVMLDDRLIAQASGVFTEADTTRPHDRGAGLLVLDFEVP